MKTMKHTKRKWKTVTDEKSIFIMPESSWYNSKIDAYIGEEIAEIKFPYGDGEGNENAEGDAKLISKAPEMYEALKRSQELLQNLNSPHAEIVKSVNESLLKEIES